MTSNIWQLSCVWSLCSTHPICSCPVPLWWKVPATSSPEWVSAIWRGINTNLTPMSIKLFLKHSRNFSVLCTKAEIINESWCKKNGLMSTYDSSIINPAVPSIKFQKIYLPSILSSLSEWQQNGNVSLMHVSDTNSLSCAWIFKTSSKHRRQRKEIAYADCSSWHVWPPPQSSIILDFLSEATSGIFQFSSWCHLKCQYKS